MIEWTLEVLEWIRGQLFEGWPGVKMRGSAPELTPEGYRVRFRDRGRQYWLNFSPDVMDNTSVDDVRALLEGRNWIPLLQDTGTLTVDVTPQDRTRPTLNLLPTMEVKVG